MQWISIIAVGVGIGWLAGLSASPVVATVLASLLGVAGGIVAGARSLPDEGSASSSLSHLDARPAAALVLAIAVGAPLGILARTHGVFEPTGAADGPDIGKGVLFGVTEEECSFLRGIARYPETQYRDLLRTSGDWVRPLEERIEDIDDLKLAVEAICEPR